MKPGPVILTGRPDAGAGWRGRAGPQVPVGGILRKLVGWPGFGWAAGGYTPHTIHTVTGASESVFA